MEGSWGAAGTSLQPWQHLLRHVFGPKSSGIWGRGKSFAHFPLINVRTRGIPCSCRGITPGREIPHQGTNFSGLPIPSCQHKLQGIGEGTNFGASEMRGLVSRSPRANRAPQIRLGMQWGREAEGK